MNINNTRLISAPGAGNGLAAISDLEAGDSIIEIANPYILVVEKASLASVCSECLLEVETLKRCARCKVAQYCSAACQKTAWSSMHRFECSALASMPGVPPTPVRALMQVLFTHSFGSSPDPRWRDLKTNEEYLRETRRYGDVLLQARAACQYAKFTVTNALELAVGIFCRMSSNAFRAISTGGDPVGLCFEPVIALANHSCSPNAAIVFSGRKIMLRALDPIKQNEQIFISYVDGTQRREIRQAELKEAYFFTCKCWKCAKDETPYQSWLRSTRTCRSSKHDALLEPKSLEEFAKFVTETRMESVTLKTPRSSFDTAEQHINVARTTDDQAIRLKAISQALETLRHFRDIGSFALPPYTSILYELYLYSMDSQSFVVALSLLLFMHLNCFVYLYPQPNHHSNVERLYTIAKLCGTMMPSPTGEDSNLSGMEEMGPKLEEAISSMDWMSATHGLLLLISDLAPLSHGVDARFTVESAAMLADVEGAQNSRTDSKKDRLEQWSVDDEDSSLYARGILDSLKRLGIKEVAEEIIDMTILKSDRRGLD